MYSVHEIPCFKQNTTCEGCRQPRAFKTDTTMNTYRFLKVLKWNIACNKRNHLSTVVRFASVCFLLTVMSCISSWFAGVADYGSVTIAAKVCAFIFPVVMMAFASELTFNLRTKQTIVNYAMLPASNIEKYLSNFIIKTLWSALLFFAGLLIADCLQALVSFVITKSAYSLTLLFFTELSECISIEPEVFCILTLFVHSTFVFGACYFRRRPMLWTVLLWILIPLLISFIVGMVMGAADALAEKNGYLIAIHLHFDEMAVRCLAYFVAFSLSALNYWLSYRLFCRIQVINNKVHN